MRVGSCSARYCGQTGVVLGDAAQFVVAVALGLLVHHARGGPLAGLEIGQRSQQHGELAEQLKHTQAAGEQIRMTTESLASALRSNSTRGVWGETQLRNVVQAAGLIERVDFDLQHSVSSDSGAGRPDMGLPQFGSFEPWSAVVPAALCWAGEVSCLDARPTIEEAGSGRQLSEAALVEGLRALDIPSEGWPISRILRMRAMSISDSVVFMPAAGSSRRSIFGPVARARAISRRRCAP